uniref:RRM domain-containing protein n=1 Tax=Aegilops tauschii subsp. strangulata TaxID=200361 RepID=A0A452YPF5_AEGTS
VLHRLIAARILRRSNAIPARSHRSRAAAEDPFSEIGAESCTQRFLLQVAMDPKGLDSDKSASRLYVGNLDFRISESDVIKMFSPYGKIIAEDFLLHTRGPKRGEPRGYAFVQYTTKEVRVILITSCKC